MNLSALVSFHIKGVSDSAFFLGASVVLEKGIVCRAEGAAQLYSVCLARGPGFDPQHHTHKKMSFVKHSVQPDPQTARSQ
jgi:hypothetical protein